MYALFWLGIILGVVAVAFVAVYAIRAFADRRGQISRTERKDYEAYQACVYRIESLALEQQRAGDYHPFIQIALDEVRETRQVVRNNNRKALS